LLVAHLEVDLGVFGQRLQHLGEARGLYAEGSLGERLRQLDRDLDLLHGVGGDDVAVRHAHAGEDRERGARLSHVGGQGDGFADVHCTPR